MNLQKKRLGHRSSLILLKMSFDLLLPAASLDNGTTTRQCPAFARRVTADFPDLAFVFMTYYNVIVQYGIERFCRECADIGIKGLIVPDAYPEESGPLLEACRACGVAPILIATPYTPDERLVRLAEQTSGFLYCAARKGVTGAKTALGRETNDFLTRARRVARTPIGVGFGVHTPEDLRFLQGKCDIAIIGTKLLHVLEQDGLAGVERFLCTLNG